MQNEFYGLDPHKMLLQNTAFNLLLRNLISNEFRRFILNDPHNTNDSNYTTVITALKQTYRANARFGLLGRIALLGEVDFKENKNGFPTERIFLYFQ